jgi:murein DD-endopeptidase MepM/ murein hydrolase activator NlpD
MARPVGQVIDAYARQLGLDPRAVKAIGMVEGGLRRGAVGDHGTSFGPFQLHVGGALPRGRNAAWAGSDAGIMYAMRQMAGVARGMRGRAAVENISRRFERPADPGSEITRAMGYYGKTPGAAIGATPAGQQMVSIPRPADLMSGQQRALFNYAQNSVNSFINDKAAPGMGGLIAALSKQQTAQETQGTPAPSYVAKSKGVSLGGFKPGDPVIGGTRIGGLHPTEGLAGYPARDYFAKPGSEVVSPVTGRIVKESGHDPAQGPIEGPHGPLGWSVYIQGKDGHTYYLTHMGVRRVKVGETVRAGANLGTVANYDKYGTPSHIHMGVK